jgi:hypothetical protein
VDAAAPPPIRASAPVVPFLIRAPRTPSLDDLFSPLSLKTFAGAHWVEKVLHVPGTRAHVEFEEAPLAIRTHVRAGGNGRGGTYCR